MTIEEKRINLFCIDGDIPLAHCISSDCNFDEGIVVHFQKKFALKNKLLMHSEDSRKAPACIKVGQVYNLITKKKYYGKPTYESLQSALELMKIQLINDNVKVVAMPKIGCGKDRLSWGKVREMLETIFADTDIHIMICYL